MALVGIIANPAASKDIRRLVAQGRVVPDWEKVNIIRRALLGLQSSGVSLVAAMPDSSHLVERGADDPQLSIAVELLPMPALYNEGDTTRAAAAMEALGVNCLITLGGDGTNRAVAKGSCAIPIIPISTGTNNVFPVMLEGTMAGLAAALVANGGVNPAETAVRSKLLTVHLDGQPQDLALVDVALSRERFVATRAIWDMNTLYEVFLTRAEPASIGLSSIGARLRPLSLNEDGGLRYRLLHHGAAGPEPPLEHPAITVRAPIAPGMLPAVGIASWGRLAEGERVLLPPRACTVALDGERAFAVRPEQRLEIELRRDGPPVVDVEAVLRQAALAGRFTLPSAD